MYVLAIAGAKLDLVITGN